MTTTDDGATTSGTLGRCVGCLEFFQLKDGAVPPHMWPHSTPLLITCSGGNQPPAEGNGYPKDTAHDR